MGRWRRQTKRRFLAAIVALGLITGTLGRVRQSGLSCHRGPAILPSVLLVTLDTARADHLSAYGYGRPTSPVLEALVNEGVRVDQAYSPANVTTPAHASLLTGQSPPEHGVRANVGYGFELKEAAITLADRLRREGYQTAGFVGAYTAGKESGLGQGMLAFEEPDYTFGPERKGSQVVAQAVKWLEQYFAQPDLPPFFVWVHLFDPHGPYTPDGPALDALKAAVPEANRLVPGTPAHDVLLYDGELRTVDGLVGRLLEVAARRGPLLTVVVADHGETLDERPCSFYHGHHLFEEQVRVPWIMAWKGENRPRSLRPGVRLRTPVSTVDLASTVLGVLELPAGAGFKGRNLARFLAQGREPSELPRFFESGICEPDRCTPCAPKGVSGKLLGVSLGGFKLIRLSLPAGPQLTLYDLEADPGERVDVAARYPERVQALNLLLEGHFGSRPVEAPGAAPTPSQEKLRALGYTP